MQLHHSYTVTNKNSVTTLAVHIYLFFFSVQLVKFPRKQHITTGQF